MRKWSFDSCTTNLCTCRYGNKCKFYHAERGNQPQKSVTEKLKETSSQKINEIRARTGNSRESSPGDPLTRTRSMQPLTRTESHLLAQEKQAICRTRSTVPAVNLSAAQPPPPPTHAQQPVNILAIPIAVTK